MEKSNFDPVVLLMLFGIYFVINYLVIFNLIELLYGIILIIYYIKCKIVQKKVL